MISGRHVNGHQAFGVSDPHGHGLAVQPRAPAGEVERPVHEGERLRRSDREGMAAPALGCDVHDRSRWGGVKTVNLLPVDQLRAGRERVGKFLHPHGQELGGGRGADQVRRDLEPGDIREGWMNGRRLEGRGGGGGEGGGEKGKEEKKKKEKGREKGEGGGGGGGGGEGGKKTPPGGQGYG